MALRRVFYSLSLSTTTLTHRRAGPTTAFGRVIGRQAYTKICAEQLCNICCEIIIIYTHLRDNSVVYHHQGRIQEFRKGGAKEGGGCGRGMCPLPAKRGSFEQYSNTDTHS